MRLPFLQVSQEEMARARTLAGYLGVGWQQAVGMVVALKAAALDTAEDGDVSGRIEDPNPAEWMAVQCGWPLAEAERLASALLRCGFVMAGPWPGYGVASMEPYAAALETSKKRSEAGRRGAQRLWDARKDGRAMAGPEPRHGHGLARDAKTQTQTQTQKEERELPCAQGAPEPEDLPDATGDAVPLDSGQQELVPSTGAKERPEDLQRLWNALAHPGLPRWRDMTDKRRRAAAARLRERPLAEWREVVERINCSAFCLGNAHGGSTWRASPDWLLQPDTATKVLEGKYDGTPGGKAALGPQNGDWSGFDDDVPPAGRAA